MRIFLGKLCDLDGGAACTNDDDGDEDNGVGRTDGRMPARVGWERASVVVVVVRQNAYAKGAGGRAYGQAPVVRLR